MGLSLDAEIDALRDAVATATVIVPVGGRTHWEVGGPPPSGTEVRAPAGVVDYDPADLTVTVGAGTTARELDTVLGPAGQQCPLDPRDPAATVGGILATGLSGHRRLQYGPLRNRLLEVHFVTADGRRVKGGGRTVKNVTGYDIARLLVGSLGTLGVIVQVTLRCEPTPPVTAWIDCPLPGSEARRRVFRPAAVLTDGRRTHVLIEGYAADVAAECAALDAVPGAAPPDWPVGAHRGRISVRPAEVDGLGAALDDLGVRWLAEVGIGTVHVGTDESNRLAAARSAAHERGGWLLREAGAPDLDGFGRELPNLPLMVRIRDALDPSGSCNPGRLRLASEGAVERDREAPREVRA